MSGVPLYVRVYVCVYVHTFLCIHTHYFLGNDPGYHCTFVIFHNIVSCVDTEHTGTVCLSEVKYSNVSWIISVARMLTSVPAN